MRGSATGNYVRKTGDTMTGNLRISGPQPFLELLTTTNNNGGLALYNDVGALMARLRHAFGTGLQYIDDAGGSLIRDEWQQSDGKQTAGIAPLDRMQTTEVSAENAGIVTILAAATQIVALGSINVSTNDRILVAASVAYLKGATAGLTSLIIRKNAGTATIQTYQNAVIVDRTEQDIAAENPTKTLFGIVKVTAGGTLTLEVIGQSLGSNSTVSAGAGELYALNLRGT